MLLSMTGFEKGWIVVLQEAGNGPLAGLQPVFNVMFLWWLGVGSSGLPKVHM